MNLHRGLLIAAVLCLGAWGAKRRGRGKTAVALLAFGLGACALVAGDALMRRVFARKSFEATTKGSLGALRSALSLYYGDHERRYPADPRELIPKYLDAMPIGEVEPYHGRSEAVLNGKIPDDTGGWLYNDDPHDEGFGTLLVNCTHTDSKGAAWTSY